MSKLILPEYIGSLILLIRGHKVMLDRDLAQLYGVKVKALIQAVKRNKARFPEDFMFHLDWTETKASRSHRVTLKRGQNIKYRPYAFTEQGIAMLSSVLRSRQAIRVNIIIMRTFVKIRRMFSSHRELAIQFAELERKLEKHDREIQNIFQVIRKIMTPPEKPRKMIGFH